MPNELTVLDEVEVPMVVNPATGEALVIRAARTDDLGGFLAAVREQKQLVDEWVRAVTAEVLRRQDADASWTTHTRSWTLQGGASRESTEYDAEGLYDALGEYVEAGVITESARNNAVERVYEYKAKANGIKALAKLGGEVAEVIKQHTTRTEKARRVSVSPRRGGG